jgi:transposase
MEFVHVNKKHYCGVDLHADVMYVCVMDKNGNVKFHHEIPTDFSRLLKHLKPFLPSIAVCAESTFNWYWLADGCTKHGIPFYLGHALYMKLIHGSKAKNDRIDSHTLAHLLRVNSFPPAYPYPEQMRATRDLLRRRHRFSMLRAGFLRHIKILLYQQGHMDLPTLHNANVAQIRDAFSPFKVPADVRLSIEYDLGMIEHIDQVMPKMEWTILKSARHYDNHSLALLRTLKGLGPILSLTVLYEIHTIKRFPTVQKFSSYARVVKVERSSHGKNLGSKNNKIGNPYLRWAFGQLAVNAKRFYPATREYTDRLIRKFGTRRAYSLMAHKFAVAVYYMLKNKTAFDIKKFIAA